MEHATSRDGASPGVKRTEGSLQQFSVKRQESPHFSRGSMPRFRQIYSSSHAAELGSAPMRKIPLPVQTVLNLPFRQAIAQFTRRTRNTPVVQAHWLWDLLRFHQDTDLGQRYHLQDIQTVDQFRDRIPILPYSAYEPYLERIAQGESNVLTPEPVIYLNTTSGSTGKQKMVPVTRRSRQMRGRATLMGLCFALDAAQRWGKPWGQMLLTSSVQQLGKTSGGIDYGPISVGDLRANKGLLPWVLAHPPLALQPADSLARHYVCLLFALKNPWTRVVGANFPVLALSLCGYLERHGTSLVDDLGRGTLAPDLNLQPDLRQQLEQRLTPDPQRANQLAEILKIHGRLTPHLVWPDLAYIVTARGGTSDFYFQRFPEYFGDTPIHGGLYASAESAFGIYPDFNEDGAILALESGFYEFIPQDQWESDRPQTLLASELQVGHCYRVLVTNYNGFYRYDIGDVVEVTGFCHQAPRLTFRHRRGGLLSSTTEKTTEFHATQVMGLLQREFDISVENFCITLSDQETPAAYLVNIELSPGHHLPNLQAFLRQFDRRLQEMHTSYAVKRRDQVPPPRLRVLVRGSFAQVREQLIQRGIPEHHLKFPHISEDRQFLANLPIEQEVHLPSDYN